MDWCIELFFTSFYLFSFPFCSSRRGELAQLNVTHDRILYDVVFVFLCCSFSHLCVCLCRLEILLPRRIRKGARRGAWWGFSSYRHRPGGLGGLSFKQGRQGTQG